MTVPATAAGLMRFIVPNLDGNLHLAVNSVNGVALPTLNFRTFPTSWGPFSAANYTGTIPNVPGAMATFVALQHRELGLNFTPFSKDPRSV